VIKEVKTTSHRS